MVATGELSVLRWAVCGPLAEQESSVAKMIIRERFRKYMAFRLPSGELADMID